MDVTLPLILATSLLSGCAHRQRASIDGVIGPDTSVQPLYRSRAGGERIYVEADLGDGIPRFFLVDTGSAVTTVTAEVAEALELSVQSSGGWLHGVTGRTPWKQATVRSRRRVADAPE